MTNKIETLLMKSGALLSGHFKLSSGKHSANYLQCAIMLQHPDFANQAGDLLAEKIRSWNLDLIISPAIGGIVIGQETARALGVRALFAERENGTMMLRRGFQIEKGERVGIIEDVVTTGRSAKEVIEVVREYGAEPVVVGSLVARSDSNPFSIPYEYLWQAIFPVHESDSCPLCADGSEAIKPGSRT